MAGSADRVPALRKAHAVYERFRRTGRPVPFQVRLLDGQYHAQFRKAAPAEAGRRTPVSIAIRQARERAGMSKRRLAATVGVTATTVRRWEYAEKAPAEQHWIQLELTLGPLGVVRDRQEAATEDEADAAA